MPSLKSLFSSAANTALPTTHSSAITEKAAHRSSASLSWNTRLVPIPGVESRKLRVVYPKVTKLWEKRLPLLAVILCLALLTFVYSPFSSKANYNSADWKIEPPWTPAADPSTLVFRRADLQKIWQWEIDSGHFPTRRSSALSSPTYLHITDTLPAVPKEVGFTYTPDNPAIPVKRRLAPPSRYRPPAGAAGLVDTDTKGTGPNRLYLDNHAWKPNVAYPPRPVSNGIADMDILMKHCDFSDGKVR